MRAIGTGPCAVGCVLKGGVAIEEPGILIGDSISRVGYSPDIETGSVVLGIDGSEAGFPGRLEIGTGTSKGVGGGINAKSWLGIAAGSGDGMVGYVIGTSKGVGVVTVTGLDTMTGFSVGLGNGTWTCTGSNIGTSKGVGAAIVSGLEGPDGIFGGIDGACTGTRIGSGSNCLPDGENETILVGLKVGCTVEGGLVSPSNVGESVDG